MQQKSLDPVTGLPDTSSHAAPQQRLSGQQQVILFLLSTF
jgi:hypothetical protein